MSNVTLAIGGRNFTVACDDGEEAHIAALGGMVAARVAEIGSASQSETRMLLYAALLLADEVHRAQGELAARADVFPASDLQNRIDRIAGRLESLADRLDGGDAPLEDHAPNA